MAKKRMATAVPSPMEATTSQHAHLEGHSTAPKLHLGQRVTAKVHGIVSEMSHQYSGKGHRISIKPDSISYIGHKAEKPSMKEQMKGVRVVASTPKRKGY
jgi:hypothetical protein